MLFAPCLVMVGFDSTKYKFLHSIHFGTPANIYYKISTLQTLLRLLCCVSAGFADLCPDGYGYVTEELSQGRKPLKLKWNFSIST